MKKIFTSCLLAFAILFCMTSEAAKKEQNLDSIVAIINEDVVTGSELSHAVGLFKMQLAQDPSGATTPETAIRKQALDQLIDKKLQLQLAKQAGIKITDDDLNKAIANVAQQNNITPKVLYERVNQEGISTEDYRKEIRDQLTMRRLQQAELAGRISITPQEISTFMHSATWKNSGPREYHLLDILVPVSDTPNDQEIASAKSRAEQIANKLKQGKDISDITSHEAKTLLPLQSEDLGFRRLAELPSAFIDHVQNMEDKEISRPIQAGNGFHILHVLAIKADASTTTATKEQIQELLLQRKFEDAMQTWLSKMKSQAYIVINS